MSARVYREAFEQVASLAVKALEGHELSYDVGTARWRCGRAGSNMYAFHLHFAPGHIAFWGDLGEAVFRVSEPDSLMWLLRQCMVDKDCYPDYFLSKVRALDVPRKVFYIEDAFGYFDDRLRLINDEWTGVEHPGMTESDAREACAHRMREEQSLQDRVRDRFRELVQEVGGDEASCWRAAWHGETGDSDVPSGTKWSPGALWLWFACRRFAALHCNRSVGSGL